MLANSKLKKILYSRQQFTQPIEATDKSLSVQSPAVIKCGKIGLSLFFQQDWDFDTNPSADPKRTQTPHPKQDDIHQQTVCVLARQQSDRT
ncbi:hypothetical protein [Mastigocladopsis repens]|uniref:hypothetical protein n=1 Tax=Mastigocladopsis repens TaxID=221287 RepID=UPI0002FC481B|nr:hypothetical protein [Mastigocladopsis repens]